MGGVSTGSFKLDKLEDKNEKGYFRLNVSKSGNAGNLPDILAKFAEKFLSYQTGFKNSIFEEAKNVGEKHDEFIEGIFKITFPIGELTGTHLAATCKYQSSCGEFGARTSFISPLKFIGPCTVFA